MIVFDLECHADGHRFEGWFGSSSAFEQQRALGLVDCPQCGSRNVTKAPMAPRLARKGNQQEGTGREALSQPAPSAPMPVAALPPERDRVPVPPRVLAAMQALAAVQAEALQHSRWVGEKFAEAARSMHYGEREAEVVHGKATAQEAQDLLEEGIAIMPLPFPVAPPDELH
jgi:hypothetical protein